MGQKSCEIELLINIANTNAHFDIYEIIMTHFKQVLIDRGLVEGEDFTIKSMTDICFTKDKFEANRDIINEISNDYFPVYAKTFLIPEEVPTWNDFYLDIYDINSSVSNPEEDAECVIISLAWNDNAPQEVLN